MISFNDTVVGQVVVPAGSYLIDAPVTVRNYDDAPQVAHCNLSTGAQTMLELPDASSIRGDLFLGVHDAATFSSPTTITLSCTTFYGAVEGGALTAIRVAGIN
jgi:hypothetical protein